MKKTVLVANVGSTSFKYQLFDFQKQIPLLRGKIERINSNEGILTHSTFREKENYHCTLGQCDYSTAIKTSLKMILDEKYGAIKKQDEIAAVGFKTVHAGPISGSVIINNTLLNIMEEYCSVVPAHNRPYIDAIQMFQQILPNKPLVAVFETSFHRNMPDYAHTYSLPYAWIEKYNIRKYGFHGASHRYVTETAAEFLHKPLDRLKIISCHLGGSSSICAVKKGHSIDTSMGFSAQSGLPMSSRNGDIDPYIIFYLMEHQGLSIKEIKHTLSTNSGLKGISGLSGDIRDLEEAAGNNYRARLALDIYCYEAKKYIGAYVAALGGLNVLIFTGGIGENGISIRQRICSNMEHMGISLDEQRNKTQGKLIDISRSDSKIPILVIPTNEELIVAKETIRTITDNKKPA